MNRVTVGAAFLLALLAVLALSAVASATGASRTIERKAVRVESGGVAVFNLKGISAARVQRATLRRSGSQLRISVARVRRAARRGMLRVRVDSTRLTYRLRVTMRMTPRRPKKPASETAPVPAPAPDPSPAPATTRAVGAPILSDAGAAARVAASPERRPANQLPLFGGASLVAPNQYRPSAAELDAFRYARDIRYNRTMLDFNPLLAHVTGNYAGTTDEILQWAAHKWGITEDIVRAVATSESTWNQSQLGDRHRVPDPQSYPRFSRVPGTSEVYASVGITQVRWDQNTHWGTEPLRWKSTAFAVDYWAATVRYYFDGYCDWCSAGYSAGQQWNSVGAWFNPSPWGQSTGYIKAAQGHVASKPWLSPGF